MKISFKTLASALVCVPAIALADNYTADFNTGMPRAITCSRVDAGSLATNLYRSSITATTSWIQGKVGSTSTSGAALCPTNNADGTVRTSRMALPAISITTDDAVLIWDGRSMLYNVPEAYRVVARVGTTGDWQTLATVDAESYYWATHCVSLAAYKGKSVQVAFESATALDNAFMIAIDNIYIGEPTPQRYAFESTTLHFTGIDDQPAVTGTLTNYCKNPGWTALRVVDTDNPATVLGSVAYTAPAVGESTAVEIPVDVPFDGKVNYTLQAVQSNGSTVTLDADFISSSYFRRTLLLDRFTGTWCSNCPEEGIVINRYKRRFRDNVIVAECHYGGNDILVNSDYTTKYASEFIYSVPQLCVNHNRATVNSAADYQKAFDAELTTSSTIGMVDARYTASSTNSTMRVTATAQFGMKLDNSDDRYRLGYLVLADIHNPTNYALLQSNYAYSTASEEFYYLPENILPKMMLYSNVVVEASTGVKGVESSLPEDIIPNTEYSHRANLTVPTTYRSYPLKVAAMLIDTKTGHILNCAIAKNGTSTVIDTVIDDPQAADDTLYDLCGRPVKAENPAPGIYIRGGKKFLVK